ncbi:hypothetical protein DUNSADRAFT_15939 [Dunaliella salina]|uniref:Uncharacterized protein n=1 Tax=Dunaliella salina TaxID=3046 RepID=A0ABQ7G4K5_DUNSA|nr:hypothetical protein DUNSADRAFT_15939 [Dunaliella salina]|eukprot:KAF5829542.1 hypothetical protein DUNSADRAFT_15939 [Dunaliella salina]
MLPPTTIFQASALDSEQLETLCRQTKECTELVLPKALLAKVQARPDFKLPRVGAVSVVLCDDAHITTLNAAHRGKAAPTDVLSFELEDDLDYKMHLPIKLLGDLVVSLDTAQRQAEERGCVGATRGTSQEMDGKKRIDLAAMAAAEQAIMAQLGWKGQGLIDAVGGLSTEPERAGSGSSSSSSSSSSSNGRVDEPLKERAASSKGASSSSSASLPTPTPGTSLAARRKRSGSGSLGVLGNIFGGAGDGPSSSDSEGGSVGANEGLSAPAAAAAAERGGGGKGKRGAQMVDSSKSGSKKRGGMGKEQGVSGPGGSSTRGISTSAAASPSTTGSSSSSKSQGNRIQGSGGRSSSSNTSSSRRPLSTSIPSSSHSSSTSSGSGAGCSSSASPLLRSGIGGISRRPLVSGRICTPLLCSATKDGVSTSTTGPISLQQQQQQRQQLTREQLQEPIRLVALDMDGTLLDNSSRIHPDSAEAIKAACAAGVRVLLATGKARPAAIRAADMAGLAGDNLLVSARTPGIFLQGLAVHDSQGQQLSNASLPSAVVADAFRYVSSLEGSAGGSLVAFLGDECVTLRMTDDLQALHHIYHEPLATVLPSLEALLEGPPVRKLLFMSTPQVRLRDFGS